MSLLGSSPPALVWRRNVYQFPSPSKGDDKNMYVPLGKVYENIDGERIKGKSSWRFEKTYTFPQLSASLYETITSIYNKGLDVIWIPHSDVPFIRYRVHIEELNLAPVNGLTWLDKVSFKVVGAQPTYKIPNLDNMIGGVFPFRIGVI